MSARLAIPPEHAWIDERARARWAQLAARRDLRVPDVETAPQRRGPVLVPARLDTEIEVPRDHDGDGRTTEAQPPTRQQPPAKQL